MGRWKRQMQLLNDNGRQIRGLPLTVSKRVKEFRLPRYKTLSFDLASLSARVSPQQELVLMAQQVNLSRLQKPRT
jgi:hypothetical protein